MIILMRSTNLLIQRTKGTGGHTYEQQFSIRVSTAMKMLDPLIHEAVSTECAVGHPYLLSLEDRVKPLLIKQLVCQIKQVTNMLAMLSKIVVSYKTIEKI